MWSLYHKEKFLEPLKFCNGKSQEHVVKEVLDAISSGKKTIFINGACGTGKSAIALNIAKELGKTSIVVPGKNLQEQYKKDYEEEKYVLKKDGEKLKIRVITGRKNHRCKFLEENKQMAKVEKNANLLDLFTRREENKEDLSADNPKIPCKIEIKERNSDLIKKYLSQNKNVNPRNFQKMSDVKRLSVAAACPYWSPVLQENYNLKQFAESKKRSYLGLNNIKYTIHKAKPGCKFYEQFDSYVDADVIVFNSLKYMLESVLNRKPATEAEIIDECDEFLDSFSNERAINLDKLQNALIYSKFETKETQDILDELFEITKQLKFDKRINDAGLKEEILPVKSTGLFDIFKILLKNPEIFLEIDEESYLFDVEETARMFEHFLDESYITVTKKENNFIFYIVTVNLAKKFQEILKKNKVFIMMSGTLHSEEVIRQVFGIEDFARIEAETELQGSIDVLRTGKEKDCKYANFSSGNHSRGEYLLALDACVKKSKKPTLVHVQNFDDLPSEREKDELNLKELITKEKLKELQEFDNKGENIKKFKNKEFDVLFSTRAARGIDFPGEECNSIIFTKYPNPNVKDAFWKILQKTKPEHYWPFYKDKARRELLQKVYRGVRFKGDHVYVLSPDSRVIEAFEKK